jgi:REP element-mobilizing transposase RayT
MLYLLQFSEEKKMKQIEFGFFQNSKIAPAFEGELLKGKRKSKRPLSTKAPMHLILRSSQSKVFRPTNQRLEKLIHRTAKESGVGIYELAINWSHIHFVIKIQRRENYVKFIRVLTSRLAMAVQKIEAPLKTQKLFTLRPFTRILHWGRDFKNTLEYLGLIQLEAAGFTRRKKKESRNSLLKTSERSPF